VAPEGVDSEKVEEKVRQILFGKAIVDLSFGDGHEETFIIRSLTAKEDAVVVYTHQKALREGKKAGLITQPELKKEFKERGLWTESEEIEIEELRANIDRIKGMMPDFKFQKSKWHTLNNRMKRAQQDLARLEKLKRELFMPSMEFRAQEIKYRKIASLCLETMDEEPFWTPESFGAWSDFTFVNNIVDAYASMFILTQEKIRAIARSGQWRYRWLGTKNGADVFGKPACEWSDAQNALIYWSLYYDMVFDDPDHPPELVNDDDALDRWVERKKRERRTKKDVYKDRKRKSPGKKDFTHGTEEVFIFAERGDKENIDKIQSMNDPATRARLRTERKRLEKEGKVREWDLRKDIYLGARDSQK
jgi:hypothetical protein